MARAALVPAAVAGLVAALLGMDAAAQQPPVFRSGVERVLVHATVRSPSGRLVPTLTQDDFELRDNGVPVELTLFSSDPQPVTAVLLLDMSGSMTAQFLRVREATRSLVDALREGDRLRIGTFGEEIALSPWLTGDKAILRRIVDEELWPGGLTPLWSAALGAMASLDGEPGRRVIVTLTDGSGSDAARIAAVRQRALDEGFMFYAIAIGSPLDKALVALTDQTGGGHFRLRPNADLAATFHRVLEELRHQYVLGFEPARDGKVHTLEVRVTRAGMSVRARQSYRAPGADR